MHLIHSIWLPYCIADTEHRHTYNILHLWCYVQPGFTDWISVIPKCYIWVWSRKDNHFSYWKNFPWASSCQKFVYPMINYNLILLRQHHSARKKRRVMLAFLRLNFCPISVIGKTFNRIITKLWEILTNKLLDSSIQKTFFGGLIAQWNTFSFDSLLAKAN